MNIVKCQKCKKEVFESTKKQSSDTVCYHCALDRVTCGSLPEEGDFNTAQIISGTMTSENWKWFKEDMEAVESGRSKIEPMLDESVVRIDICDCTDCSKCGDFCIYDEDE